MTKNMTTGRQDIAVVIARIAVIGMIFMVVTRGSIEMISAATMIIAIMVICGDKKEELRCCLAMIGAELKRLLSSMKWS